MLSPYKSSLVFSDYWKDPSDQATYLKESRFLADVNNEKETKNAQYKKNIVNLDMYVMIEALWDTMVEPHASEQHGFYKWGLPQKAENVEKLEDTEAFKGDWLGLKTLKEAGKIKYLSYRG